MEVKNKKISIVGRSKGLSSVFNFYFKDNKIETLWGVGGNDKSNSSSWILKKWKE